MDGKQKEYVDSLVDCANVPRPPKQPRYTRLQKFGPGDDENVGDYDYELDLQLDHYIQHMGDR